MKINLRILIYCVALAVLPMGSVLAEQVKLPISGLIIAIPPEWGVYELDLGKPFGKTDVIMDKSQEKVISFMIIPSEVKNTNELISGIKGGLKKQGASVADRKIKSEEADIEMFSSKFTGRQDEDERIYAIFPKHKLILLSQIGVSDIKKDKGLMEIVQSLK